MQRLENPFPLFLDARGNLLDGGKVYVGTANADPETSPLPLFKDQGLTQAISQPLRTLGGLIVDGGQPVFVYLAAADYSLRIRDADGSQVVYIPSTAIAMGPGVSYQPLDSDLTAIAALGTTAYGRSLLTLANQAALQAAVGVPAALPLTGGTVTGAILRSGAGAYGYALNPAMTGFRLCGVDPVGTADATSQPGDWQAFY